MKKTFLGCLVIIAVMMLLSSCGLGTTDVPESDLPTPDDGGQSHIHNFDEWETTKNPTCTENGEKIRYCSCGEEQTKVVSAPGHTEVVDKAVEPTCTETGLTEGKHCSECDEIIIAQTSVDAKGHTEVIDKAMDATCTETGLTEGKHCSVCDTVIMAQSTISIIAHTYDDKYDEICNKCGFVRDAECAHANTTTLSAVAATCTQTGLTEGKVCTKCEEIIVAQTVVPAKGHTEVIDKAVEPTCTETGLTEGKHCSACNTVIVAQTLINAKGHIEVINEAVEPTNCITTGLTEGKHCGNCGEIIIQQTIVYGEHSFENRICILCGEEDYSKGLIFKSNGNGTCDVIGIGTCTDTNIIIPFVSPDGNNVTGIGKDAFNGCDSLTNIKIPNSVTSIGYSAFRDCTSLTSIVIPDSVTSIDGSAFYGCTSLTSVVIPDGVTSIGNAPFWNCSSLQYNEYDNANYIGNEDNPYVVLISVKGTNITSCEIHKDTKFIDSWAFENCTSLTSIAIPDSVTSIGYGAFYNCSSLTSMVIPDGVTSIGHYAFSYCTLLSEVVIGDSITSIGYSSFSNCSSLQHNEYDNANYLGNEDNPYVVLISAVDANVIGCEIHKNTKIIGGGAFEDCTSLTSIVIPDSVTSIGDNAFYGCTSLADIIISDGLTSIGNSTFYGCTSLANIIIPDSVTNIGDNAFHSCYSLASIVIPKNVTSIGDGAFLRCDSLINISVSKQNEFYKDIDGNLYTKDGKTLIQYVIAKQDTQFVIPEGVTNIGDHAFFYCTSLTNVVIPDSVTSIGDGAFGWCDSITHIVIPEGVISIGDGAFNTSLTSIVIPDSVTSIGDGAFQSCYRLTNVYFTGTTDEWAAIRIGDYNWYLTDTSTIHYNYVP